jgi:hypothetical protein
LSREREEKEALVHFLNELNQKWESFYQCWKENVVKDYVVFKEEELQ